MISHISLGTNNLEQARSFYGQLISLLGGKEIYASGRVVFWGFSNSSTKLALTVSFNNESANFGNGTMVTLKAENEKKVDRIYCMALSLGAVSEGEPGHRDPGAFYGAYFRDLDGNKVAIFAR